MQDRGEFCQYVEAWRERLAGEESSRVEHAHLLRRIAQDCARCLGREFSVTKVYLFGSLLEEGFVHERSDIDLAVEGLDGRLYWQALASLWKLLPRGVELDLVPLEQAWPGLAERVLAEGVLLYVAA